MRYHNGKPAFCIKLTSHPYPVRKNLSEEKFEELMEFIATNPEIIEEFNQFQIGKVIEFLEYDHPEYILNQTGRSGGWLELTSSIEDPDSFVGMYWEIFRRLEFAQKRYNEDLLEYATMIMQCTK